MAERRSLEGVFSLPPRARADQTPATEPAPVSGTTRPQMEARTPRRLRSADKPTAKPSRDLAATSFYVPADRVAAPWRARARQSGQTLAEVLVAATQAIGLEQVAQALQKPRWETAGGGMPSWNAPAVDENLVNVQVRLGAVQLQWLDDQVQATGATSRSHLVATLLSIHLN